MKIKCRIDEEAVEVVTRTEILDVVVGNTLSTCAL
jgi:hypothetical protein